MSLERIMSQTASFVRKNKGFCIWASAAILAGVADIYMTTTYAKTIQEEANPIMRHLWENYGVEGMVGAKIAAISFLGYQAKKTGDNLYLAVPSVAFSLAALAWYFK